MLGLTVAALAGCSSGGEETGDAGQMEAETRGMDDVGETDVGPADDTGVEHEQGHTVIFELTLFEFAGSDFTINVYDEETGEFVGGLWDEEYVGSGTQTFELRRATEDGCVGEETASLSDGSYRAYFAMDTDNARELSAPEACDTTKRGFISDGEELGSFQFDVPRDATIEVGREELVGAAGQTLQIRQEEAADGTDVTCQWRHPAHDGASFQTAMLGEGAVSLSKGTGTIGKEATSLPSGDYRVGCVIDVQRDGQVNEGDYYASESVPWDEESETIDEWRVVD